MPFGELFHALVVLYVMITYPQLYRKGSVPPGWHWIDPRSANGDSPAARKGAFPCSHSCNQARAYPGVGIEFGHGRKLVAGLFDRVFYPQPVQQRALGLLLAGRNLDEQASIISMTARRFSITTL